MYPFGFFLSIIYPLHDSINLLAEKSTEHSLEIKVIFVFKIGLFLPGFLIFSLNTFFFV